MLRSRLAKLMEILFVAKPKEVLIAVREKGFPLLVYQSLLAVWGGLMHTSPNSNTSWEHEAMRGSWSIQSIDSLVQEVLGRFARTEEIRELAPRIARGWKAEGVFADCCNDTGRRLNSRCCVVTLELRDSQIHTSFCPSQCRCHRASEFSPKVRASRTT
jgi:hypothetical protein